MKKIKIFVDISESKVYDNKASCRYDNLSRSLRNKQKEHNVNKFEKDNTRKSVEKS